MTLFLPSKTANEIKIQFVKINLMKKCRERRVAERKVLENRKILYEIHSEKLLCVGQNENSILKFPDYFSISKILQQDKKLFAV